MLNATQTSIDPGANQFHLAGKYEADHIPADWNLAAAHAKAVLPGKHMKDKIQACPCCMGQIEKESVGYCENTKELAFLGEGFPLFYNFLRYCIVMLVTLILDDGIIGVLLSLYENQCTQVHRLLSGAPTSELVDCQDSVSNRFAYINSVESIARTAIKITGFVAQLLLLIYFRDQQNKLAAYIDERNCTMSDYTLYVENIPVGQSNNKQKIARLINSANPELQVMDILIIEHGEEYLNEEKELKKIVKQRQNAIKKEATNQILIQLAARQQKQRIYIHKLERAMRQNESKYFHGEAFIVMNTEEQKEKAIVILNELEVGAVKQEYPDYTGQTKVLATEASEPKEIIWQNIHSTKSQRYLSIFWGWLLTIAIMAVVTTGFFFLIRYKGQLIEEAHLHYTEDPKYQTQYTMGVVLGYIIVILINLFNKFIFATLFYKITHHEKHISVSSSNYSFALKYTLCMFFTTALMTLLVEAIIANNYTGSLGLIEEETSMFIFNAYFSPLMWLINPYNIVAWIKRKIYYGNHYYTQQQANHLMELPEYNMGKRYAEIIKTIWFTFLYIELIPFGAIYSLTGLILYYLVDKYILLYRCSIKDSVSSKLSRTMVTVLDFTLVLKPAGELIFDSHLRHQLSISSLAMLCVGIVYILLPVNAILEWALPENFQPEEMTYEQAKDSFPDTYFTLYPIKHRDMEIKYLRKSTIEFMSQMKSPLKRTLSPTKILPTEEQLNESFGQFNMVNPHSNKNAVHNAPSSQELPPLRRNKQLV